MHTTSVSLLQRLREPGNQAAWERFVELYIPLLWNWTRQAGVSETDAADLIQDVFAKLVEELPRFEYDPARSFRAWLKTVTLNRWRSVLRKRTRLADTATAGDLTNVPGLEDRDPFWEVEYRQHLVSRALAVMRAEFRPSTWQACWEFVVHDKPAAQVAAELGISENAVHIAKFRVLRRLRQELDGLLD